MGYFGITTKGTVETQHHAAAYCGAGSPGIRTEAGVNKTGPAALRPYNFMIEGQIARKKEGTIPVETKAVSKTAPSKTAQWPNTQIGKLLWRARVTLQTGRGSVIVTPVGCSCFLDTPTTTVQPNPVARRALNLGSEGAEG
eukprot:gene26631-biopygen4295